MRPPGLKSRLRRAQRPGVGERVSLLRAARPKGAERWRFL